MKAGESKPMSSPSSQTSIRAPRWYRTLYVGSFVAWVVLASILLFVGQLALSLMFWLLAVATLPVAVACSIKRLEYRGNKLVLVRLTGRVECPVHDVASMRLTNVGNGMSCFVLLKQDSTLIDARGGWRAADVMDLANRLKIPVVQARRIGFGTQEPLALRSAVNLATGKGKVAFIGGLRTLGFNVSWPFAGLTLTDEGFTLRFIGLVHLRGDWAHIESAQRVVGGLLRSPGVRLVLADGRRLVFWSSQPDAVLNALRTRGVQITDPDGPPPKVWLST